MEQLARIEFALTAGGHFLCVALTLGLATLIAIMQTMGVSRDRLWFWARLYVVNYAFGIVTGIVMEIELALNWNGLLHFLGNPIGSALALETLVAFFVESTFLGLWLFGWDKLSRRQHLAVIWVVTLTAYASAYLIMVANGYMQQPVAGFAAMLTNPPAWTAFAHIVGGGLVTGGLFVAGIGAYHRDRASIRLGTRTLLPGILIVAAAGHQQFVRGLQPMKIALWDGTDAERAALQGELTALYGPGEYLPPEWAATALLVMLGIGAVLIVLALAGPWLGRLLLYAIPLPFVAMLCGWIFREVGRQPWAVYGRLRTSEALTPGAGVAQFVVFPVIFVVLAGLNVFLLVRQAKTPLSVE